MQNKFKKILIVNLILLIVIVSLVAYLYPKVEHLFSIFKKSGQLLSLNSTVEHIDEDYLEEYNPESQRKLDVLHYDIAVELFPGEQKIKGDVEIQILLNDKKSGDIELNFYDNLKIESLMLNGNKTGYSRTETNLAIPVQNIDDDTLVIDIRYEGKPKKLGFGSFNFDKTSNAYMIYTLNEPVFASTWYPCIDLPDDKAYLDIYITNDSNYTSVSNGRLVSVEKEDDKKIFHWKTYNPISTYLISIYSAAYRSYSDKYISAGNDTLDLVYYATDGKFEDAIRDFSNHKNYLKVFEEIFGEYPFMNEKYGIAEFGWRLGAMENQTITGIGSAYITGKKFFQDMIIHELAHSWWGNAVGPKTWKDIWLNEGFATYSEALYWEREAGFDALKSTLASKNGRFSKGTLYNPENQLFSRLVYDKGAWVLHMLRKEVGDEIFFKILRNYYSTYKYKNASTDDFKKKCEKFAGKKLDHFFDQWIYKGEGFIEAGYSWNVKESKDGFITELTINQLQNGYDIYKFPIDIKLIYNEENKFEVRPYFVKSKNEKLIINTKEKPKEVILDPDNWLLAHFELKEKAND